MNCQKQTHPHPSLPLEGEGTLNSKSTIVGTQLIYQDIPGFCRSVTLAEIAEHGHVLTPGRYVGVGAGAVEDEVFAEKMQRLTETLGGQMAKGAELDGHDPAKAGRVGV